MTSDPSIQRRVSRLENETEVVYESRERFDQVEATLASWDGRFDGVRATLAEVVHRLPEPS